MTDRAKELCMALLHADTETKVIELLETAGYWSDDRWAILRQLDALATGLSASEALWAWPIVALARAGLGTDKRTNHMAQLSGTGPAELKTAATLAAATSDTVLGAAVAALLDRMPRKPAHRLPRGAG